MGVIDYLKGFTHRNVAPVVVDPQPEKQLISADDYSGYGKPWEKEPLSMFQCRRLAYSVPLFYKAIHKKNMDIYRSMPFIKPISGKLKAPDIDNTIFDTFNRRTNIRYKMYEAGVSADMYGTGFLLITFINDDDGQDLSLPPKKIWNERLNRDVFPEPRMVTVMNSENISDTEYLNDSYKRQRIRHYIYSETGIDKKFIHPDRLIPLAYDRLPFSMFGVSKTQILRHVLDSFVDIDVSAGETLKWSSHGLVIWTKQNMKVAERKAMLNILKTHPNAYAVDEQNKIAVEKPEAIDPSPFYDFLCLEISAAFVMPVNILKGIDIGKTTGAEVGYGDYRKDISDVQYLKVNPHLIKLYTMLFESYGREFNYDLMWEETYIDEMTEANILFKRASVVERLFSSGTADRFERRGIMNDGYVFLDPTLKSTEPLPSAVNSNTPKDDETGSSDDTDKKEKKDEDEMSALEAQELRLSEAKINYAKKIKELSEAQL